MTANWSLTFDCVNAKVMASFWIIALGYVESPPPLGWPSWEEWLRDFDIAAEDGASISDPSDVLPRVGFLKVPEGKRTKNRVHVDLQVSGGRHVAHDVRSERIEACVTRLIAAGGRVLSRQIHAEVLDHVCMADPEGNEFCVA